MYGRNRYGDRQQWFYDLLKEIAEFFEEAVAVHVGVGQRVVVDVGISVEVSASW